MKKKCNWLCILFLIGFSIALAQEKTVSGTVSDQDGFPLPGVNVLVKGTTNGTQTDFDGNYAIAANEGDVLVFSYIGQKTTEQVVSTSSTLNIQMEEDRQALEEVVVTAQGIKAKPRSLSYSVQSVDSDDITKSRETNLVSALSAKAAGVQVTSSSGSVGASANIRIRGNTSITRSNSPLFVVDGVPIDNSSFSEDPTQTNNNSSLGGSDFSNRAIDINSNDIESVNILKGIAAQTLYGLRAANGVVLITTKKGREGKTTVTLNTSTIFSDYNKGPELQQIYAQGRHNGGQLEYRGPETGEGDSWGPRIADLEFDGDTSYPFDKGGRLVPVGTGNGVAARAYDPYDFFITGEALDLNLAVSGGNENINYRASIGRLIQNGISPNEAFERKTFRLDMQAKLNDKISLDASGQYANSGGFRVQRGSNISGVMLGLLRTAPTFDNGNGLTGQAAADNPATYYYDIEGQELPGQRSYRDGIYNSPYFAVARNKNLDDVNRFIGKLGLTYQLNDWLNFRSTASIDRYTDVRKLGFDVLDASFNNGRVINDVISNQDVNWNFLVNANYDFNDKSGITANIGYDGYYTKNNRQTVLGDGMTIPGFFNLSNVETTQAQELTNAKKLIGAFATATLSYDDMLFLTPAFRNDWSSTLPVGSNTFQSYSVGGSFVFSELLNEDSFINYGKLRGSWGKSGNDAPIYATITNFGGTSVSGDGFIQSVTFPAYDATSFERSSRAGNPDLKPEETTEFEIGAELSMLNSRLRLDFTYYDKETIDQIIPVDAAPSSGFIDRFLNAGVISNTGYELTLSGSPIRTENFNWNMSVNWTTYENVVEELVDGVESITLNGFSGTSSRAIAGESYGSFFGSRFLRNEAGDVLIDDNGYPLQNPEDGLIGDPIPDWIAGLTNSFSYKNFGLSVLFDVRQGGDVWCGTCGIIDYFGVSAATLIRDQTTVFNGVVQSTGAVNTQVVPYSDPTISENNNWWRQYGFGGLSETAVYHASWVRLREVTLSYDFPSKLLDGTFISGISISGFGRNLWLSTDYPGVDPETNLTGDTNGIGLDYFNQPNTRSYGLDVKLNF
ncbi:SusC/RagA family TonB-linked outer membrane protein [Aggregatimonas sangjinii]|uniref:SusC/RagA family TonB-linked outer membrane protein n=1 Tax=Aggregatimonas sangjinii TaxID=2583587 RepID=A0A5B7SVA6_9FLAO|nr:SusC/RagA family TonB-linked outer membrane protein [Aggregatimonas sangjinii]QCX00851.1 SusC/RagA family TonB-linked outer membrane protein [Aggregatimonas sangjinii]